MYTSNHYHYFQYYHYQATDFHDTWFQSPRKDLEAAGIMTEFFKHTDVSRACAISATAALEKKLDKLDSTNAKLRTYIDESGAWPGENGIKTVRSLLDMLFITGVIHGGTLSAGTGFSRAPTASAAAMQASPS